MAALRSAALRSSVRAAAAARQPPASAVRPPLAERPATHAATAPDFVAWLADATAAVDAAGDSLAADGGPDAEGLRRELRWLLEDAVPDPPGWRGVFRAKGSILLRAPLAHLRAGWAARVNERVPHQYLTGASHWRDLVLAVGPGVLVPRPETGQLVDEAVAAVAASPALARRPWADAGTGSGALAIGIARSVPKIPVVHATDASGAAAAWARLNVRRCGVAARVAVAVGDWLTPLGPLASSRSLGGLVSNPPYIPTPLMAGLQPEVGLHEPQSALDGGSDDGVAAYASLLAAAPAALAPGAFLGLETHGHSQAETVAASLAAAGAWRRVRVVADDRGVARFVLAERAD